MDAGGAFSMLVSILLVALALDSGVLVKRLQEQKRQGLISCKIDGGTLLWTLEVFI